MKEEKLKQKVLDRLSKSFQEDQVQDIMKNYEWAVCNWNTSRTICDALLAVW